VSHDIPASARTGLNAFRLMPDDDPFRAPSSLDVSPTAAGRAVRTLLPAHWFCSTLCMVAIKVATF
jgi:hypothetical protein